MYTKNILIALTAFLAVSFAAPAPKKSNNNGCDSIFDDCDPTPDQGNPNTQPGAIAASAAAAVAASGSDAKSQLAAIQALQGTATTVSGGAQVFQNGQGSCVGINGKVQCANDVGQSL